MSVIDSEAEPGWVREVWSTKSGDLSLTNAVDSENRVLSAVTLVSLAGAGLFLSWGVSLAATGDFLSSGIVVLLATLYGWNGLHGLDNLDCRLRESHDCRSCRKETERWKANGEVSA